MKSRMYASKFPTERSPVAKCVMIAEANTDAPKSFCDAPDGTGHRDMARSESSARELGRPADAKAAAGVGGSRSSGEAGNDRGAKGSCIESASNRSAGADSLRKKRMTDEEIAAIAAKHRMAVSESRADEGEAVTEGESRAEVPLLHALRACDGHGDATLRLEVRPQGGESIWRGWGGLRGHRAGRGRRGRVLSQYPSGTQGENIPRKPGQKGLYREGERQVAPAGHTHRQGQGGADGGETRHRAHFRGGLPRLLVRLPPQSGRTGCGRADSGEGEGGERTRLRRRPLPHDKLLSALEMRIADGSVLNLIRQWLKACAKEPNGVMVKPKGKGTPQGGVISPLLSNIYLHWFETIASLAAKAMGQAMSIVRYADDFVILAKNWVGGFLRKVESILEERMGLTVNREKTKLLNLDAERSSLTFLGYEFRKVRDRLFGTGKRYLHFGPSPKSVKRVCQEVHKHTHSRNVLLPVDVVVDRVNKLLKGWGEFYSVGYPSRVFRKVNHYVLKRMARFLNRKSQRYYRLKFADTYYGEMTHYGLYRLAWADVRRAR